MDISQIYSNEMLINFGTYVMAGILGAIFYALVIKGKKIKAAPASSNTEQNNLKTNRVTIPAVSRTNTKIEFIKLGENKNRLPEQVQKNRSYDRKSVGSRRENHMEIIKLAKAMMKTGTSFENIKKVLPVSESELTLLEMNNN